MRGLIALICLFIVFSQVSAEISSDTSITANGGIHQNYAHQSEAGDDISLFGPSSGEYHQIGAAQGVVTGMGNYSRLSSTVTLNDGIDSSSELYYSSGGTYFDTLASSNLQPNESEIACTAGELALTDGKVSGAMPVQSWVDGQISGMGKNAHVTTDKSADTEGYAFSESAVGQGLWQKDITAGYLSGNDKDSDTLNNAEFADEHNFASGIYNATTDFVFEDFSEPTFSNETVTNESGNVTPEQEQP